MHVLPFHDWRGILHDHDNILWLSPVHRHLQCSGVPAIVEYMNAVRGDDALRARMALRTEHQIVILMGKPGESCIQHNNTPPPNPRPSSFSLDDELHDEPGTPYDPDHSGRQGPI
jgi:hypothetical protein